MLSADVLSELRSFMPPGSIMADPAELTVYDCDGFTVARAVPGAVVFPTTPEQVAAIIKSLGKAGVQIVPRGSGTGLAGGRRWGKVAPMRHTVSGERLRIPFVRRLVIRQAAGVGRPGLRVRCRLCRIGGDWRSDRLVYDRLADTSDGGFIIDRGDSDERAVVTVDGAVHASVADRDRHHDSGLQRRRSDLLRRP